MTRIEDTFDFRNPDYLSIFRARAERLNRLRQEPALVHYAKARYREHVADFILDWGTTSDPRNVEIGRPAFVPFVLWPKQREWCEWVNDRWRGRQDGLTEKSRDSGATWLAIAMACSLCMLYDGIVIGFGSRKAEYVNRSGGPKSLFAKIAAYMRSMPTEFRGGWDERAHMLDSRCVFPGTGSIITGESGDEIGRGDRTAIYFVDEAAFLEHPDLADSALSQTTNCRIDISTPCGMANSFAIKRHSGRLPVFTFHWRSDPRKDEDWYARQVEKYDPVTVAQEIDISYTASVEGIIIQPAWVQACIDAHLKMPKADWTGARRGALDIADEGINLNAFAARHGNLVLDARVWSGKGSVLSATVEKAFGICDELGLDGFDYDADGGGAHARDPAQRINARRAQQRYRQLRVEAYRGSSKVHDPERKAPGTDVKNEDRYQNAKAQSYGALAERCRNTFEAVNGRAYDPANLISLSSSITELAKLCIELSQPQWKISTTGKLVVDKLPDGALSPDLADAVMILMAPKRLPVRINPALLQDSGSAFTPA